MDKNCIYLDVQLDDLTYIYTEMLIILSQLMYLSLHILII